MRIPSSLLLLLLCLAGLAGCSSTDFPETDWPTYQGDPGRNQYSTLKQIDRGNVGRLRIAWSYRTGDASPDNRSQIQCNPLIIGGVLYGTSPQLKVFALEADSGRELWKFDPFAGGQGKESIGVNRGVAYWAEGSDRRILFAAGPYLYALNADSGDPVKTFGEQGRIDLRKGLDRDNVEGLYLIATTPGAVFRDLLIIGDRLSEGPGPAAPGHIRAFNIRTGERAWIFHTIPHPGEFGYETWPEDAWQRTGGANCWSGMSVDTSRGIVYVPTGSATFDFWGGDRKGANLFANTLLALDASTGRRIWHYQFVHHDIWDRDLPAPPNLVTLHQDGQSIEAVAQVTKSGHVFVFDRDSGAPIFPVEELPVPPSDLKGEEVWPTQPLPVKPPPFARQKLDPFEVTDRTPEARRAVLDRLSQVRSAGQFVPPSTQGTVIYPGFDGGAEWGGAAFDPDTGILYVNSNEMAWILTMIDLEEQRQARTLGQETYSVNCGVCHGTERQGDPEKVFPPLTSVHEKYTRESLIQFVRNGKGFMPSFAHLPEAQINALASFLLGADEEASSNGEEEKGGVPYSHSGYNRFFDPDGYPAVKPPWGTLNAIDLNRGELLWQVPLGELPELTARGIPPTGTENYGGPVVTAGGLIFIAASKDEKFRAFDKESGKVLWETQLPAGGYATPSTYQAGGRQFVVIAAGGGKMGTKSGDYYMAFALP